MNEINIPKSLIIRNLNELPRISPFEFDVSAPSGQHQYLFGSVITASKTTLVAKVFSTSQSTLLIDKEINQKSISNK